MRAVVVEATALVLVLLFTVLAYSLGGFIDESVARKTLELQGYRNVEIVHKDEWFVVMRGCGGGDFAKFDVVAINHAGEKTSLYVCAGLFTKPSIRTN